MSFMSFDSIRAALVALLSQPVAVASVVLLVGAHAAIWLLMFERVGFPPVLASLLLLPPFTLLLPLYVALARWPGQRFVRLPKRPRSSRARSAQRTVQTHRFTGPVLGAFHSHRPLRLAADGLPRFRISLPPSTVPDWPTRDFLREAQSRDLHP